MYNFGRHLENTDFVSCVVPPRAATPIYKHMHDESMIESSSCLGGVVATTLGLMF